MSRWMISHASAYIITPILAAFIIGLAASLYYGSFVDFGFGVAIVSFMFYIFLLVGLVGMLVLFFIRKKESAQTNLLLLIVLSIIGGFIFQTGMNTAWVVLYYAVASIIYVILQLIISNILVSRFNIHDEFLKNNTM